MNRKRIENRIKRHNEKKQLQKEVEETVSEIFGEGNISRNIQSGYTSRKTGN